MLSIYYLKMKNINEDTLTHVEQWTNICHKNYFQSRNADDSVKKMFSVYQFSWATVSFMTFLHVWYYIVTEQTISFYYS
jgi:hypothetical protein